MPYYVTKRFPLDLEKSFEETNSSQENQLNNKNDQIIKTNILNHFPGNFIY